MSRWSISTGAADLTWPTCRPTLTRGGTMHNPLGFETVEPLLTKARDLLGARAEILRAATRAARSLPDETASDTLARLVERHPLAARRVLTLLKRSGRSDFESDFAYRLLESTLSGDALAAPPAGCHALFDRERQLGHSPLVDAFDHLSDYDPRLRDIADRVQSGAIRLEGSAHQQRAQAAALVPRPIGSSDPLCESDLARTIVVQYLLALTCALPADLSTSYFALPRKLRIRTVRAPTPRLRFRSIKPSP